MRINTTRFGRIEINADDVLLFPTGLVGLEDCRHWVLLADAHNESLGWLQSISRAEVALAVVCPRRFVPEYQLRVAKSEMAPLEISDLKQAQLLAVVGKNDRGITLNLKAPIVLNLERRLGRQVIANGELSVQHVLEEARPLRMSA